MTDINAVRGFVGNKLAFSEAVPEEGLKKCLIASPDAVIETLVQSGLRGCGGAGFTTGMKWKFARAEKQSPKYIVCNADEGEPGTFKDRLILTDYFDLVCEGMTIAGRVVGAEEGIIYLRAEYSYLRSHLEQKLEARRTAGLLGRNVSGEKGFSFDIDIRMGMGAYVCGEETALLESLEGHRGEPRNRFPFPVQAGYKGMPTVINNVETFAWVPVILQKGADWFFKMGTEKSHGAKLFSVSGACERPGVYEYPFGTKLSRLLSDAGAKNPKAVQVGGASGVCVSSEEFDRCLAFEDLATGGSIIIFSEGQDMFAVAENFQHFFAEEACGQCVPCRVGNLRLHEGIVRMRTEGLDQGTEESFRQLCSTMKTASKCGLGQSAPNAFLSILNQFSSELPACKNMAQKKV